MPQTCSRPCFIAVHVGAGYHAEAKEPEYASAMHAALRQAAIALQAGSTADVAVARAIMALEVRGVLHTSCTLGSACELGRALVTGTRGRVVPPLVARSGAAVRRRGTTMLWTSVLVVYKRSTPAAGVGRPCPVH